MVIRILTKKLPDIYYGFKYFNQKNTDWQIQTVRANNGHLLLYIQVLTGFFGSRTSWEAKPAHGVRLKKKFQILLQVSSKYTNVSAYLV